MTLQATGTWRKGFHTVLEDGRRHEVEVDLPVDEGGEDAGTSALELNLMSLAGCISTIFALVARKRRLPFEQMRVDLEGSRRRGSPTITSVGGRLQVVTDRGVTEVETALQLTLRTCPVGVLYEQAGIPITIRAVVHPPGEETEPSSIPLPPPLPEELLR